VDAHTVELKTKNGEVIQKTTENVLLAMGGRPTILDIPGAKEFAQTSDDIFWSKKPFGKTLVIGSGYIALECGGFLSGLGKDVTILYRGGILRAFDQSIVDKIVQHMKNKGVNFVMGET
jgi:pyruvate/2-oxoglutarate dehydrogenase complex dihydrolipoamide dehydrogenase (E3) component